MQVGDTIEGSSGDCVWKEREYVGRDKLCNYICKGIDNNILYTWYAGREIKEPTVYYYRWKKIDIQGRVDMTTYMTDKYASMRGYTECNEWVKIESSKTTYEEIV